MPLWTHSGLPRMPGVGKRQTELRNLAPHRHSVTTLPLAGPVGQRTGTGTLLHMSYCLTQQQCVGAEHTFREAGGRKTNVQGILIFLLSVSSPFSTLGSQRGSSGLGKNPAASPGNTSERRYSRGLETQFAI